MIPFLLALSTLALPALGQTQAYRCDPDVWAQLYSRPGTTREEYRKLWHKMLLGLPSDLKARKQIFAEILELPDPTDDSSRSRLSEIESKLEHWHKSPAFMAAWADPSMATQSTAALWRVVLLRQLVAGEPLNWKDAESALYCLEFDREFFPNSTSVAVWKHRAEVALIRDGEQRNWEDVEKGLKPELSPFHNIFYEEDGEKAIDLFQNGSSTEGAAKRAIEANVMKALVLNPTAKSHRSALKQLLKSAEVFLRMNQKKLFDEVAYPRGFIEAMTGYLDPKIFPPEKQDPKFAERMRDLLPQLGIRFQPDQFDEFPPKTKRRGSK
jgi:hypothetical protein